MDEFLSRKGQKRREQILEHAIPALAKQGFRSFNLSQFAKRLRIPPSLVLYHFKSVEGLFESAVIEVIQKGRERAEKYLKQAEPGRDAVNAWVDSMYDWIAMDPASQSIFIQLYCETRFNQRLAALNSQIIKTGRDRIENVIREGIHHQAFAFEGRDDAKTIRHKAEVLHDIMTGTILKIISDPLGADPVSARRRTLQTCLDLLK